MIEFLDNKILLTVTVLTWLSVILILLFDAVKNKNKDDKDKLNLG